MRGYLDPGRRGDRNEERDAIELFLTDSLRKGTRSGQIECRRASALSTSVHAEPSNARRLGKASAAEQIAIQL